jgi:alcohol dehydrogenase (cytochrome c)
MTRGFRRVSAAVVAIAFFVFIGQGLYAQVSFERILRAIQEPQNWLTYSGNYNGQRYSPLTQINRDNVRNLELQWVLQVRSLTGSDKFEATPLVVDGVMYTVRPPNEVVALDAATGRIFWVYTHTPSQQARVCCGRVNRGLAILGNTLFMGTIDGRLIAIDASKGTVLWNVAVARPEAGYALTVAPLVVKDKVIAGPAGGEFGIRGFLAAYDAATGKEIWRFNTIPGPGEPGHETWGGTSWMQGGGSIWTTGAYDPELNLTYWGIGNPGPDWNGDNRPGDNLYTESVVALDADSGKLRWHYQFTPHDEFDFDSTQVPVLADIQWQGRLRKLMLWANRNGFWYILDRLTGEFIQGKPFTKVNWAEGFNAQGRPNKVLHPSAEGTQIFPNNQGATNWYSPSYSPRTGLFYIPSWVDTSSVYTKDPANPVPFVEGQQFTGIFPTMPVPALVPRATNDRLPHEAAGAVLAFDPRTGEKKWEFRMSDVTDSGVLTTASDLLFTGGREGYFMALDARDGTLLWKTMLGGQVANGPMAYSVNGRQFVTVAAGNAMFTFALKP